jgi:FKBP-type peptidyl-prolyl cis-trans isomerase
LITRRGVERKIAFAGARCQASGMAKAPLRSFFYLLLLGGALLTLALVVRSGIMARKSPGRPMSAAMRDTMNLVKHVLTAEEEQRIAEAYPGARENKSGLRQIVRASGAGLVPREGQMVVIHYEARRLLDGTLFDSSRVRGTPLRFVLGASRLPGWDEALRTMKAGERRTVILPWWLAYGEEGSQPDVAPRTSLIFEIELVEIK